MNSQKIYGLVSNKAPTSEDAVGLIKRLGMYNTGEFPPFFLSKEDAENYIVENNLYNMSVEDFKLI